jgi:hypothetical protein
MVNRLIVNLNSFLSSDHFKAIFTFKSPQNQLTFIKIQVQCHLKICLHRQFKTDVFFKSIETNKFLEGFPEPFSLFR